METVIPLFGTPLPAPLPHSSAASNDTPVNLTSVIEQPGLVNVLNLATGAEIFYLLDPRLAVICAYEQYGRRNWNTWSYLPPDQHPHYRECLYCVACGDFTAMLRMPTLEDMRELKRRANAILNTTPRPSRRRGTRPTHS